MVALLDRTSVRVGDERYRRANGKLPSVHKLVEMKALGLTPEDLEDADGP